MGERGEPCGKRLPHLGGTIEGVSGDWYLLTVLALLMPIFLVILNLFYVGTILQPRSTRSVPNFSTTHQVQSHSIRSHIAPAPDLRRRDDEPPIGEVEERRLGKS